MTFFAFSAAVERDFAEVPSPIDFLTALRVGFLAPTAALGVFRFVFVDCFFAFDGLIDAFFFGGVDAGFAFRFDPVVRFLAAPIAAPESAPITVPTTGRPRAVPATAPATAPPSVLPAVPIAVSDAPPSLFLSSIFLSIVGEKTLSFMRLAVNAKLDILPTPSFKPAWKSTCEPHTGFGRRGMSAPGYNLCRRIFLSVFQICGQPALLA